MALHLSRSTLAQTLLYISCLTFITLHEKKGGSSSFSTWSEDSLLLCRRNRDVRVKHLVMQPGNAPKSRSLHLTMADAVNEVSPKDSPSKTAKIVSFEGRRSWIETQPQSVMFLQLAVVLCRLHRRSVRRRRASGQGHTFADLSHVDTQQHMVIQSILMQRRV